MLQTLAGFDFFGLVSVSVSVSVSFSLPVSVSVSVSVSLSLCASCMSFTFTDGFLKVGEEGLHSEPFSNFADVLGGKYAFPMISMIGEAVGEAWGKPCGSRYVLGEATIQTIGFSSGIRGKISRPLEHFIILKGN